MAVHDGAPWLQCNFDACRGPVCRAFGSSKRPVASDTQDVGALWIAVACHRYCARDFKCTMPSKAGDKTFAVPALPSCYLRASPPKKSGGKPPQSKGCIPFVKANNTLANNASDGYGPCPFQKNPKGTKQTPPEALGGVLRRRYGSWRWHNVPRVSC
ncbi:MAG: hypothetical protein ACLFTT_12790 [Candidatus Hydrogenedentota bacterium]